MIDAPDFNLQVANEDPLIAAVSKLQKMEIKTQTYPPIVIQYAVRARNVLFEYIQKELKDYSVKDLLPLLPDAELPPEAENASQTELPVDLRLRFTALLAMCYLRLAVAL